MFEKRAHLILALLIIIMPILAGGFYTKLLLLKSKGSYPTVLTVNQRSNFEKSIDVRLEEFVRTSASSPAHRESVPPLALGFHGDDSRTANWKKYSELKKYELLKFLESFENKNQFVFAELHAPETGYYLYIVAANCEEYDATKQLLKQTLLDFSSSQVLAKADGESSPLNGCWTFIQE